MSKQQKLPKEGSSEKKIVTQVQDGTIDEINQSELAHAIEYIFARHQGVKVEQIAEDMGITRQGLWLRVKKWKKNGTFARASDAVFAPQAEEIRVVYSEVVAAWPHIIRRMVDIARNSRSDYNAIMAFQTLNDEVIKPWLENQSDSSGLEQAFADTFEDTPPTQLPGLTLDE